MTQDEIIEMARDSGMVLYGLGKDRARFVHHLEAFANLVAAKALAEHAMREVQRLGQEIEQARTWVGLTNKERAECWETIPELAMQKVEAKLKEKNT